MYHDGCRDASNSTRHWPNHVVEELVSIYYEYIWVKWWRDDWSQFVSVYDLTYQTCEDNRRWWATLGWAIEISRFWPTISCRAKRRRRKHGDVVHRRCLCFLLFMVFPLDEIVLRIPSGCDSMKSFCTVVPNSYAWCLLISATATWPVMVLYYRLLGDDVSGWEYFCSSVNILRRSDTSSCLSFDPFPLCYFVRSMSPCQKMYTYNNKVVLLLLL